MGNGNDIYVGLDPLIPKKEGNFMAENMRSEADKYRMVRSLMEEDGRHWDLTKLTDCFSQRDVRAIMSIPLSRRGIGDKLIWDGENIECSQQSLGTTCAENTRG